MNYKKYCEEASKFAIYPRNKSKTYLSLGLLSELGEIFGKLKKKIRGDKIYQSDIDSEIGDVLWYISQISPNLSFETKDNNMDHIEATEYCLRFLKGEELGDDLLSYLQSLTTLSLFCIADLNIIKLKHRKETGNIKGDGDYR